MATKNKIASLLSFVLLWVNLSGCEANQPVKESTSVVDMAAPPAISSAPVFSPSVAEESAGNSNESKEEFIAPLVRQEKIIREADVKFQVKSLEKSTEQIEKLVNEAGAMLVRSTQTQDEEEQETFFTIRVLPEKFYSLLSQLQKESVHLDKRAISTRDVGLEYADLQARTQAKKAIEARYLSLLKEAKNVEEILKVEEQLKEIREEIESTEARLRYLKNQTAYSTIRLTIYQLAPVTIHQSPNFMYRVAEALSGGWQMILSIMLGLLYVWPLLILAGVAYYFFRRRRLV